MRKSARRTFGARLSVCHAYENAARLDRCWPFQFQARLGRVAKNTHSSDWRKSETEKPRAGFSHESDDPRGGFLRKRAKIPCAVRERRNDGSASARRKDRTESRESVPSVLNLGLGVCRGARASLPYLPGMPREMTAHLLPYTACAARISLSSSSVNGPRFTVGLSWLHHLRVFGRNNENGNKSENKSERLVRKGEGTRGDARGWGGSAFEDQARKRASRAVRDHRRRARRAHGDSRGIARPGMRSEARAP